MEQKPKLNPAIAAIIVIVLVGLVASAAIVITNNSKNDSTTQEASTTDVNSTLESTDTSRYKDGTYSATGSYISPGGRESIELTVEIKDGVIVSTSVKNGATDAEAEEHQTLFANNYKKLVVGKEVGTVKLSRVAGSSLTSNGFNDALNEIKDEARV